MSKLTKNSLEQSLKNLLKTKPLNRITINDLVEDCGISRMTFYYHFQDIYDLVEWSCLEDAKKALKGRRQAVHRKDLFLYVCRSDAGLDPQ